MKYRFHNQHQTASEKHGGAQQGVHTGGPHAFSPLCNVIYLCLSSSAFLITVSDFKFTDSHQPSFLSSRLISLLIKGAHVSPAPREWGQVLLLFFSSCPRHFVLPSPTAPVTTVTEYMKDGKGEGPAMCPNYKTVTATNRGPVWLSSFHTASELCRPTAGHEMVFGVLSDMASISRETEQLTSNQ